MFQSKWNRARRAWQTTKKSLNLYNAVNWHWERWSGSSNDFGVVWAQMHLLSEEGWAWVAEGGGQGDPWIPYQAVQILSPRQWWEERFQQVMTCLNTNFGKCSYISGRWIGRLWEGPGGTAGQETSETAGGKITGPWTRRRDWPGRTLLLRIRGNQPSALCPLTFWKITELCQNCKNKPWGSQQCLSCIMGRTINIASWSALYFHIDTFLVMKSSCSDPGMWNSSFAGTSLHCLYLSFGEGCLGDRLS